jgi:acetylornithine deacetylase/succinyl-diaminopimelate desuccinylase-like protein
MAGEAAMTRDTAIAAATRALDEGTFVEDLRALVAIPSESQDPRGAPALRRYLDKGLAPRLERLGFACRVVANPSEGGGPFLLAERFEDAGAPTVLTYGHGDVIRGQEDRWTKGDGPWRLSVDGERIYGRGAADNKGQHLVNLTALAAVLEARGRLGFNLRVLIETGEETASPGLNALCAAERAALSADVLIASDGPRLSAERPTLFMGARGGATIDLEVELREGAHHSGNWGGLLADPGLILAHALASITDARGAIRIPEWRPTSLTPAIRAALADLAIAAPAEGPAIDADWGEPGLSAAEKVFGWNSFCVLAFVCGDPAQPVNAIQPRAWARCQLRFVVGTDPDDILPALRRHLDREGFGMVSVRPGRERDFTATRVDPDDPWARWAAASVTRTTGAAPTILPNLGGSLPNEAFAKILGMPTIWVPHSYSGCSQHAPDEHALKPILREGLAIMAGLWWDLGEPGTPETGR